jgi:Mg-chelatase subunit ChlD
MKAVTAILLALLAGLVVAPKRYDFFSALCFGLAGVVVAIVAITTRLSKEAKKRKTMKTHSRLQELGSSRQRKSRESFLQKAFLGAGYGLAVFLLALSLMWVGEKTPPLYGLFYDGQYLEVVDEVETLLDAGKDGNAQEQSFNIGKAIELIDAILADERTEMSEANRRELARTKYDLLVKLGKLASTAEEARVIFDQAIAWAIEWEFSPALAEAEYRAVREMPTPYPTATPMPTYTPMPTWTPIPTNTPIPTPTSTPEIPIKDLPDSAQVEVVRSEFDNPMWVTDFSLTTQHDGNAVAGLSLDDVRAYDAAQQQISAEVMSWVSFKDSPDPIFVTVVIDKSGSMEGAAWEESKRSANELIIQFRPQDRVRVISFNHEVTDYGWMNQDVEVLMKVNSLQPEGDTALWDAIKVAGENIAGGPHIVVVLTDGADTASSYTAEVAKKAIVDSGSIFYAVGIRSPDFNESEIMGLTDQVGGKYYSTNLDELWTTFQSIGREAVNLYRLAILDKGTADLSQVRVVVGNNNAVEFTVSK